MYYYHVAFSHILHYNGNNHVRFGQTKTELSDKIKANNYESYMSMLKTLIERKYNIEAVVVISYQLLEDE
ncbi:hypothetical protein ELBI_54 [Anabaena phage Elbi]|nr:hypothetical protein ELBI_54 [Anabaena phage Elbi]